MTTMFLFVIASAFLGGVFAGRQLTVLAFVDAMELGDPHEGG
jgi:hypothetical protein